MVHTLSQKTWIRNSNYPGGCFEEIIKQLSQENLQEMEK